MPELSTAAACAFAALALSLVASKPLAQANGGFATAFAGLTVLTMIASIARLATLIGWWTILAFFLAALVSGLIMRPAFKVGGRGTAAVLGWVGYIVPTALVLCVVAWVKSA